MVMFVEKGFKVVCGIFIEGCVFGIESCDWVMSVVWVEEVKENYDSI